MHNRAVLPESTRMDLRCGLCGAFDWKVHIEVGMSNKALIKQLSCARCAKIHEVTDDPVIEADGSTSKGLSILDRAKKKLGDE